MSIDEFKATVEHYGADNLLSISFDNSGRKVFREGEFSLEKNVVDSIQSLQFTERDVKGTEYVVVKHIENVQGMTFISSPEGWKSIDPRLISF